MPLKPNLIPVITLIATCALSQTALADKPKNPTSISGKEVISIYNGKTWLWSKGGSYWGSGGKFEAVWEEKAVAVGKWYATTKGTLCYEALWKSEAGKEGAELKRCWKHVRDSDGVMWKQDLKSKEWYRAKQELTENMKSGNKIKREVRKRRKTAGL